jgi:hypothetical protein
MVTANERTARFEIRIAPQEIAMLRVLAEADGLSSADIIRTLIRRSYAERFGEKKPTKSKPKK